MAINSKKAGASKSEIISVFLVYVMLIVLIYNLTREVLLGMPSGSSGSNLLVIPAAFILPLALLIYVLINARKLHLDIKGGSPGARFKNSACNFIFCNYSAYFSAPDNRINAICQYCNQYLVFS